MQLPLASLLPSRQQPQRPQQLQQQGAPPLTVEDDGDSVCIRSSSGWELRFSQATGGLASWTDGSGRQLLAAPLSLCFYRAPTDNDRGGSGGSSYAARWVGSSTSVVLAGTHVSCSWRQSQSRLIVCALRVLDTQHASALCVLKHLTTRLPPTMPAQVEGGRARSPRHRSLHRSPAAPHHPRRQRASRVQLPAAAGRAAGRGCCGGGRGGRGSGRGGWLCLTVLCELLTAGGVVPGADQAWD